MVNYLLKELNLFFFSNLNFYKLWKSNILLGDMMAKNIERTPTLSGESAKEFLEDMKRPNSPKEGSQKENRWNKTSEIFINFVV